MTPYEKFCELRDKRAHGAEAPLHTEAQAFALAHTPVTDTGLPELRNQLRAAVIASEPITLSHLAAGSLHHAMTIGHPQGTAPDARQPAANAGNQDQGRAELEAARNVAYPVPVSPHASVNMRAVADRTAFTRGWDAARKPAADAGNQPPHSVTFHGYHDSDEHYGPTILELAQDRIDQDSGDMQAGHVFSVCAAWVQDQDWRVVSRLPLEVERISPPAAAPRQPAVAVCTTPPSGWYCTRAPGHDGPCAAYPVVEADGDWIAKAIRDVAELPDRDSPADQPEMMLVSADELRAILADAKKSGAA